MVPFGPPEEWLRTGGPGYLYPCPSLSSYARSGAFPQSPGSTSSMLLRTESVSLGRTASDCRFSLT